MSYADKLKSLMARPNEDLVAKDDVPWWMKYSARGTGTVGGGIAIFLGVWNCTGIVLGSVDCLLAGVWQMLAGFIVIVIEAPCCCMFIEFVQTFSDWVDKRPNWNRAAFYLIIALPPVVLCFGFSSLFGSGLIFVTGILYGLMAVGKKATAEEMRNTVMNDSTRTDPQTGFKSPLTDNAEPMGRSDFVVRTS